MNQATTTNTHNETKQLLEKLNRIGYYTGLAEIEAMVGNESNPSFAKYVWEKFESKNRNLSTLIMDVEQGAANKLLQVVELADLDALRQNTQAEIHRVAAIVNSHSGDAYAPQSFAQRTENAKKAGVPAPLPRGGE